MKPLGQARSDGPSSLHASAGERVKVAGKFLRLGEEKLFVTGVTYGAFEPDADGREYRDFCRVEQDFTSMAAHGINAVRIPHTTPPVELLDIAERHGLRVMVGLAAEQYVGYMADKRRGPDVRRIVRERVRTVAAHPGLLCYALGNEVPAPMVRWLGPRRIEGYLEDLAHAVRQEDPTAIVTYVNYPSTEYLDLPFLDVLSFNVYLEEQERLEAYVARLQNLAGDRPLLMSEIGLDSLRNGVDTQAVSLAQQLVTVFKGGCAGAFVFAWTDDWYRADAQVDDWEFGITDRERRPKPALFAVQSACA